MLLHQLIAEIQSSPDFRSLCEVADDAFCRERLVELQRAQYGEVSVALQQQRPEFGLRFLLAVIYVARRHASEGQIWPAVREGIQLSASIADTMFLGNGHPRPELKTLLEKCCRHYRLRHIFGDEGAQEWFGSIYLQFGFTRRGFSKMLPEWLMGYSQPKTISRLLEDPRIQSDSFGKLWDGLLSFRRGNVTENQARSVVTDSPWILPEWTDELLLAAKKKPHLTPASRGGCVSGENAPRTFLSEPVLIVETHLADALWRITLEELAELKLAGNSYRVSLICGEMPARETVLRKQPDGSFSNSNEGRRLLAFSDSRGAAARLGPKLGFQHEVQLFLAALVQCMGQEPPVNLANLKAAIALFQQQLDDSPNDTFAKSNLLQYQRTLTALQQGGTVGDWADKLAQSTIIQQIIDRGEPGCDSDNDPSTKHKTIADDPDKPSGWDHAPQRNWEDNSKGASKFIKAMLGRELARLSYGSTNLQMARMVEVNYPGLDGIKAPDALLAGATAA